MWEITPEKPASVYECIRSCRYTVRSECHLDENRASRELMLPALGVWWIGSAALTVRFSAIAG